MTPQSPNEALHPEAAPPPPPPRSRKRRRLSALSGFLSFLLFAAIGAMLAAVWGDHRLQEPGPLPADKVVFIQKGNTEDIIEHLVEQGIVDSPFAVRVALFTKFVKGERESLKSGEYLFRQQASIDDVLSTLTTGKQILHAITIPEGLTTQQVVQRLRDSDVLIGDIRDMPKEGAVLPETYKVSRGASRNDLLNKMKQDERHAVEQIWARRSPDLPLRSPYELVTLASIVEKETGKADERPRVAGVFINRLRKRMRLQSDPTIVYGLVGGQGTLGHAISRSELDKLTAYNTYLIDGLPPGPIDNPGRAALEAVANPSRTGDLYFVADGTGGHAFAETVEQHVRNVQRWRQIERDAREKGVGDVDKVAPSALPSQPAPRPNQRSESGTDPYDFASYTSIEVDGLRANLDTIAEAGTIAPAAGPRVPVTARIPVAVPLASNPVRSPERQDGRKHAPVALAGIAAQSFEASGFEATGFASTAPPKGTNLLDGPVNSVSDDPAAGGAEPVVVVNRRPPEHPKIFDASQDTALDPLRNHDYDLNSAKTVPDLTKSVP